jgi:hypothetical protein
MRCNPPQMNARRVRPKVVAGAGNWRAVPSVSASARGYFLSVFLKKVLKYENVGIQKRKSSAVLLKIKSIRPLLFFLLTINI